MDIWSAHVLDFFWDLILNIALKPIFTEVEFIGHSVQVSDAFGSKGSVALDVFSDWDSVLFLACFEVIELVLNFLVVLSFWGLFIGSEGGNSLDEGFDWMQMIDGSIGCFIKGSGQVAGSQKEVVRFGEKLRWYDIAEVSEIWHVCYWIYLFIPINIINIIIK